VPPTSSPPLQSGSPVAVRLCQENHTNEEVVTGVDVDVNEGVVTLTGHLPTAADRQKAYDDAAKVTGVNKVVNHIDVP
jgi:osmotically-inducible protein OsmY